MFSKTRKLNHNSYLLLAMFFLIFLIKPQIASCGNYCIGKIDTNITNRKDGPITEIMYDQDSTIWLNRFTAINYRKKDEDKFTEIFHKRDTKKLNYELGYLQFDGFGNIVDPSNGDMGMLNINTKEYKVYKFWQHDKMYAFYLREGIIFGNKMFIRSGFSGDNECIYLMYDEKSNTWKDDTSYVIRKTLDKGLDYSNIWKYKNKLYAPYKDGLYILDPYTNEEKYWENATIKEMLADGNSGIRSYYFDEERDITTLSILRKKRAYILRIFGTDSAKSYKLPYVLSPYWEEATHTVSFNCAIPLIPVDKEKNKFIVDFIPFNLTYWSEEEGFKYIPPPEYIKDPSDVEGNKYRVDSLEWLQRNVGFQYSENELWVAGGYRYIYRFDIQKMVESRNDDFPFKNWKSSVEDDTEQSTEQRFIEMDIFELSPVPSRSHLNVKYYLTAGFGNLNIRIYDIEGKEYNDTSYEIVKQSEITRTVRINLPPGLHSGVYMLHLEESGKTCSKKFVVE